MEDNDKVVAPEVVETPEVEAPEVETPVVEEPKVEETKEVETNAVETVHNADEEIIDPLVEVADEDTSGIPMEERMSAIEAHQQQTDEKLDMLAEEQTKIVDILERISDEVLTEPVEEPVDEVEVNSIPSSETEEKIENKTEEPVKEEAVEVKEEVSEVKVEETEEEPAEKKEVQIKKENEMTEEQINALVEQRVNSILDAKVEAPEVKEEDVKAENSLKNWKTRYNAQVLAAWNSERLGSVESAQELKKINKINYNELIEAGRIDNTMTIESLGTFVLPPEMDTMIHGKRTNYAKLLEMTDWSETDRLEFAWATRVGDIDMQNVKMCDDGADGNLKPISEYELTQGIARLEELAAVTPICTAATRFLAADILQDVAAGYRTDYDRKKAQLVVIRLQQAINATGQAVEFDPASSVEALVDFLKATTEVSDSVVNGKFLFNSKTFAAIQSFALQAGTDGPLGQIFINGEVPTIFGYSYAIVPNDLLPTLGVAGDKRTFKAENLAGTVESVDITSPVFYGDFEEFRGKVAGGLQYDVDGSASYEINGEVRSAYQRNELVLRGSFFRGGYIADPTVISGLTPATP